MFLSFFSHDTLLPFFPLPSDQDTSGLNVRKLRFEVSGHSKIPTYKAFFPLMSEVKKAVLRQNKTHVPGWS